MRITRRFERRLKRTSPGGTAAGISRWHAEEGPEQVSARHRQGCHHARVVGGGIHALVRGDQEATRDNSLKRWSNQADDCDMYMEAGSAAELGRSRGLEQTGFWRRILEHPTYDAFWSQQAMDKILGAQPLRVPTMLVHGLWDQEDIYGAPAVYRAIEPKDTANDRVYLVAGPWYHGQQIGDGSALGGIRFDGDTARTFRRDVLGPFLAQYLKDGAPKAEIAPVTAFETGTNTWRRLNAWPAGCVSGCRIAPTPLYLGAGQTLGFDARRLAHRRSPSTCRIRRSPRPVGRGRSNRPTVQSGPRGW